MAPLDGPLQPLRVGVVPLHAHLLPPATSRLVVEPHLAFWRAADAVRQLKTGRLDAVLLPLAGMVAPSEPPEPPALSAAAALNPSLGDPEVVAIALATAALPFLVAAHHLVGSGAPARAPSSANPRPPAPPCPEVLLPPACHQPLIPRTVFPQDLLYSFGAFMTICRIQRNDAEARVKAMAARHWQAEGVAAPTPRSPAGSKGGAGSEESAEAANVNLEELAADRIERLIEARFKGHDLALLVEAILQAEGYTTYRSPEGADGGADILAGGGELGFGKQQICVEVKSGSVPIDRPTVDKLIGAGQKFGAETCLFVSLGGFRPNVQKELASQFFRVRLWSRKELLVKLFAHYDQLPEELRIALPLKRVWMVAQQED